MKIIIAGTGTAGLLSAAVLKYKMPESDITILDGGEGVIGVGEATYGTFIKSIVDHAGINLYDFVSDVDPVAKYGLELDFGEKVFHYTFDTAFDWKDFNVKLPIGFSFKGGNYGNSPFSRSMIKKANYDVIEQTHAVHIDNKKWLECLTKYVKKLGVNIIKTDVDTVERDGNTITSINNKHKADYYIDCTGFKAKLTKSKWKPFESLINDRALFFLTENDHPIRPYTLATTMNSGWLWQIDHFAHSGNGYVYSSKYITDEQAKEEVEHKIGKKIEGKVIRFKTGRREKHWEGNVISVGNSDNFIEPLEATSINIILHSIITLSDIFNSRINPYNIDRFNSSISDRLDHISDFIAAHFIYNKKLDTKYWNYYNKIKIKNNTLAYDIIEYYKHNDANIFMTSEFYTDINPFGVEGWYSILRGLNV